MRGIIARPARPVPPHERREPPHDPRHERPAVRQRRPAPRAHRRVRADRHLGALPAAARPRLPVRLRERRARHADHAQGAAGGHHAGGADRARRRRAAARLRRLRRLVRQLPHDALAREPRGHGRHLPAADGGRPHPPRDRSARRTTSRRRCSCPTATCAAPARAAARSTSTATAAKSAAPPTRRPTCVNAISVVSGTPPVQRDSEHLFFRLGDFEPMLREWTGSGRLQPAVTAKLDEWFTAGLRDWDISRDAPYFGFEIPGETGQVSSTSGSTRRSAISAASCSTAGARASTSTATGRPARTPRSTTSSARTSSTSTRCSGRPCCTAPGYRPPTAVYAHGFLTVNGQKMSKSRGTFITARAWLDHLPAEYLRYFYASRLGPGVDDLDLNLDEFVGKINSDLVGKLVNIASRCAGFIARGSQGRLAERLPEPALVRRIRRRGGAHRRGVRGTRPRLRRPRDHAARRPGQPATSTSRSRG